MHQWERSGLARAPSGGGGRQDPVEESRRLEAIERHRRNNGQRMDALLRRVRAQTAPPEHAHGFEAQVTQEWGRGLQESLPKKSREWWAHNPPPLR